MSHKCGANCRRKQIPNTRRDCPSCGSATAWMRKPFFAGGQERRMSEHFRRDRAARRPEFTAHRVKAVLNDWIVRCKSEDREQGVPPSLGWSHWGWVGSDGQR